LESSLPAPLTPWVVSSFWPWRLDAFHAQLYSVTFLTPAVGAWVLLRGTTSEDQRELDGADAQIPDGNPGQPDPLREGAALPQPLANRLIRLAAFQNPEFCKAQAMRMPVWDKRQRGYRAMGYRIAAEDSTGSLES
jgi:hypothetical protein